MSRRLLLFILLITAAASLIAASDASAQWENVSEPGRRYTDFAISGSTILVGNDGSSNEAALRSPDLGQTWAFTVPNIGSRNTRAVHALPGKFVIQASGGYYSSMDDGVTWSEMPNPGANFTDTFFDTSTGAFYATTQDDNLMRSMDLGETWEELGITSSGDELTWVHARGDVILSGYNNLVGETWLSTDGGASFSSIAGVTSSSAGYIARNGDLFVLTSNVLNITASGPLVRSRDGGATWETVVISPTRFGFLGGQHTPYRQEGLLLVTGTSILYGHSDRLYISHDDGVTFADASEGLLDAGPRASAIKNWMIVGDDMYLLVVSQVETGPTDQGYGLHRRSLAELGIDATSVAVEEQPGDRMAVDVWPNPVQDRAAVRVEMAIAAPVRVGMWDLQGREVMRRDFGYLPAGSQTLSLPTSGLLSGMYILRVETGGKTSSRTVAVVR